MSKAVVEKAVIEKSDRIKRQIAAKNPGAVAHFNNSDMPKAVGTNGSRVLISRGDVCDDKCTTTMEKVDGRAGRVDGLPYVAVGGPNKGKVLQPVRMEGTNSLVSVPTDRIRQPSGRSGSSRPRAGWSRQFEDGWNKIFGAR